MTKKLEILDGIEDHESEFVFKIYFIDRSIWQRISKELNIFI